MKQILVVDDDPSMRRLLNDVLRAHYGVTLATNGVEALTSMRHDIPDAIVLDMMMPVMDGRAFLVARRALPGCASVPVLVISAEPNACDDGRQLGAQSCMAKPFDLERLLGEMARLLDRVEPLECTTPERPQ